MPSVTEILPLLIAKVKDGSIKQSALAEACGCSQSQVSRILAGKTKNLHGVASKLHKFLGSASSEDERFEVLLGQLEAKADPRQQALLKIIRYIHAQL